MAKAKKLTPQDIISEVSQYQKLKKIVFEDGLYYTEIYEKFDPSKVDALLMDFAKFIKEFEEHNGKIKEEKIQEYLFVHIVKHFSTMCEDIPDTFAAKVSLFDNLLKSKYVRELQKHFDQKEIAYVYDVLTDRIQSSINIIKASENLRNELSDFIKNDKRIKNRDVFAEAFLGEKIPQEGKKKNGKRIQKSK